MEDIGKGGFGTVYRGLNVIKGTTVAIKSVPLLDISKEESVDIENEILLMKNLEHDNICKYIGSIRNEEYLLIILEFIENGAITELISKFNNQLPESLCQVYITQVLQGLVYLHDQGVIHRDIKGANILTTKEGTVKLADFGVATNFSAGGIDMNEVVGTPYWMAPEIIEMKSEHNTACDVWSVGCTVIELLTGKPPYFDLGQMQAMFRIVQDEHPPLPDNISPDLEDFLLECFKKDPAERITAKKLLKHPWLGDLNDQKNEKLLNDSKEKSDDDDESESEESIDWDVDLQEQTDNNNHEKKAILTFDNMNDNEDDSDPFADMSDDNEYIPSNRSIDPSPSKRSSLRNKFNIAITKKFKKLNLSKFVENDEDNILDDIDIDDDNFNKHFNNFNVIQTKIKSNNVNDDDIFDDIDLGKEEKSYESRFKAALNKIIDHLTPKQSSKNIRNACAAFTEFLNSNDNRVKTILFEYRSIVMPIMDILEYNISNKKEKIIIIILKMINLMIKKYPKYFQQSMAMVGMISTILPLSNKQYHLHIRLEVANFIYIYSTTNNDTRKLLLANNCLLYLKNYLILKYNTFHIKLIDITIHMLELSFHINTNPKKDICRLFYKYDLIRPLLIQLLDIYHQNDPLTLRITTLLHLVVYHGDLLIKIYLAKHISYINQILAKVNDDNIQILLLKIIRSIAMESHTRLLLQQTGIIPILIPFLNIDQHNIAALSQVLAIIYDLCRLSPKRQEECAMYGIIPHLKRIINSDLAIKQFAFSTLFLLVSTKRSQIELLKYNGIELYLNLLKNQYWSIQALKTLSIWIVDDSVRIGFLLSSASSIQLLLSIFCSKANVIQFSEILGSFYTMISVNPRLLTILSHNDRFVNQILKRIQIHKKHSKLKIDLLKSLQLIITSNLNFKQQFKDAKKVLTSVAEDTSAIMIAPLAKRLLKSIK